MTTAVAEKSVDELDNPNTGGSTMSNEANTDSTQGEGSTSGEDDAQGASGESTETTTTGGNASGDADEKHRLAETRAAEKAAKKEAAKWKAEAEKLRRAQMTEQERKDTEAAEAREQLEKANNEIRQLRVTTALQGVAGLKREAVKAAMALAEFEYDDAGNLTNLDSAVKALKKEHGYLFGEERKAPLGSTNANDTSDKVTFELSSEQADMAARFKAAGVPVEAYAAHATDDPSLRERLFNSLQKKQKP